MRNLLKKLRLAPKKLAAVVAITAAVIAIPAISLAWGPDRETFTTAHPANYVTFNSITDNPVYGDERNFVNVKDAANTQDGGWQDTVNVQPGKKYLVRMYVHNNAAENLNLKSINTRVKASVPTTTGKNVSISGFVSSDNAKPGEVWDDIHFASSKDFNLAYVPGSARIYNNGYAKGGNGQALPDSIVTSAGAKIGYNGPDGIVPGCFKYDNYVYFEVQPQFAAKPDFTVTKDVRKDGTTTYGQTSAVQAGDKVNYRITFKNTGEVALKDVVLKDKLPAGVTYVAGTAKLQNSNYQYPNMYSVPDTMFSTGANIGDYAVGGNAFITFTAKVAAKDALPCGPQTLKNIASVATDYGTKDDDAVVTVDGNECKPEAKYTCDALSVQKLSRTEFKFSTAYTVENATLKSITYVVKNAAGTEVYRGTDASYTQTTPGAYTVQAYVTVTVDGQDKTVTSANCAKPFTVTPENEIEVCDLTTKKVITIKESEFDSSKHSKNLEDCKEVIKKIKVCDLTSKQIITINEADFDSKKHSKNLADCTEPGKIVVCDIETGKVVTISENEFDSNKHSKDLSDCETTPVVEMPTALPETGGLGSIVTGFSIAGIVTAAAYVIGRRNTLG